MTGAANRRVFVGVDGSLTGLRALRQAVVEARCRRAELCVVYVRDVLPATSGQLGMMALNICELDGAPVDALRLDQTARADSRQP